MQRHECGRRGRAGVFDRVDELLFRGEGPALFIATQTWHGATLFADLHWSRPVALSALVVAGTTTTAAPAYLAAAIAAAIVVTLAAFDDRRPTGDARARPVPLQAVE